MLSCDLCTGVPFQDSVNITKVALRSLDKLQTGDLIVYPFSKYADSAYCLKIPSFGWVNVGVWAQNYVQARQGNGRTRTT